MCFFYFSYYYFFPTHFPWNCTFIGTFLCKVDAYHMAIQTIQVLDAWSLAGHCSSQCVLISPLPWRFSRSRVRHVVHKIVWSLLEESPWLGLYRASQIEMLSDRADNRHRRISESFPGGWSSEAEPLCWLYRRRSNSEAFYAPPRQLLPVLCEYLSEFNHKRFNSSPIDHWNKWKLKKKTDADLDGNGSVKDVLVIDLISEAERYQGNIFHVVLALVWGTAHHHVDFAHCFHLRLSPLSFFQFVY